MVGIEDHIAKTRSRVEQLAPCLPVLHRVVQAHGRQPAIPPSPSLLFHSQHLTNPFQNSLNSLEPFKHDHNHTAQYTAQSETTNLLYDDRRILSSCTIRFRGKVPFASGGIALVGGQDAFPGGRDESRGALQLISIRVVLLQVGGHDDVARGCPGPDAGGLAAMRGEAGLHSSAQKRTPGDCCWRGHCAPG